MTSSVTLFAFTPILIFVIPAAIWFLYSFSKLALIQWKSFREKKQKAWLETHEGKIHQLRKKYAAEEFRYQTHKRLPYVISAGLLSAGIFYFLWSVRGDVDEKLFTASMVLIVSAPVLLVVWYFRDQNRLKELDRQHQDVNLKEFQKLQEWATGNISDGYDEEGNQKPHATTLQISALHSLRPYLKGQFGESFKLAAYEIFYSVLSKVHEEILITNDYFHDMDSFEIGEVINEDLLTRQLNQIVSEEWFSLLYDNTYSKQKISLVGVDLSGVYLRCFNDEINLSGACLIGANLTFSDFSGVYMPNSDFSKSNALFTKFDGCNLDSALMDNTSLSCASFKKCKMTGADLSRIIIGEHVDKKYFFLADVSNAYVSAKVFHKGYLDYAVGKDNLLVEFGKTDD